MADEEGPAAGTTLAAIPELVENILLEMPIRDALLAQQVSHTWRNVVQDSSKLQKALFLRPCCDYPLQMAGVEIISTIFCGCDDAPKRIQAEHVFALCHLFGRTESWARDESDKKHRKTVINPFLIDGDEFQHIELGIKHYSDTASPNASLRNMLLTQPPVKAIILWSDSDVLGYGCGDHLISRRPGTEGITIDDVLETAKLRRLGSSFDVFAGWKIEKHEACEVSGKAMLKIQSGCGKRFLQRELG